jgi:hypothetical protein
VGHNLCLHLLTLNITKQYLLLFEGKQVDMHRLDPQTMSLYTQLSSMMLKGINIILMQLKFRQRSWMEVDVDANIPIKVEKT